MILNKIEIAASQMGSKFKFAYFESGQNQHLDILELLKFIHNWYFDIYERDCLYLGHCTAEKEIAD